MPIHAKPYFHEKRELRPRHSLLYRHASNSWSLIMSLTKRLATCVVAAAPAYAADAAAQTIACLFSSLEPGTKCDAVPLSSIPCLGGFGVTPSRRPGN